MEYPWDCIVWGYVATVSVAMVVFGVRAGDRLFARDVDYLEAGTKALIWPLIALPAFAALVWDYWLPTHHGKGQ